MLRSLVGSEMCIRDSHYLKMWGCLAKVLAPLPKKTKLGAKTMDCILIGYSLNSSVYRFLVYKLEIPDIHVNMIIKSRHNVFFEDIFPYKQGKKTRFMGKEHMK